MKLSELELKQRIVIQIKWGERKVEFSSFVEEKTDVSILVTPYIHKNSPLEINIDSHSNVVCNVFAEFPGKKLRVWKNAELRTVQSGNSIYYYVTHKVTPRAFTQTERRGKERVKINIAGRVYSPVTYMYYGIEVLDISDSGIAFAVNDNVNLSSQKLTITFDDVVNGKPFNMYVDCTPVRVQRTVDGYIWGCTIDEENKDFLLYSFIVRLRSKNNNG